VRPITDGNDIAVKSALMAIDEYLRVFPMLTNRAAMGQVLQTSEEMSSWL